MLLVADSAVEAASTERGGDAYSYPTCLPADATGSPGGIGSAPSRTAPLAGPRNGLLAVADVDRVAGVVVENAAAVVFLVVDALVVAADVVGARVVAAAAAAVAVARLEMSAICASP